MSDQNPYGYGPPNNPPGGYGYPQDGGQSGKYPPGGGQPGYGYPQEDGQPGYGYPQDGGQSGQYPPGGGQPGYGYPQDGGQSGQYPPGYTGDPSAPYGYDPFGRPYSDKSKVTAGLLSFFLGGFGVGRFYTGHIGMALGQLFTCGGCGVWALIDAIILLTGNNNTDSQGRVLRG